MKGKIDIRNKRASFEYIIFDKYIAGIVLSGTEIKSIRQGKLNFVDSFCIIINGEIWIKSLHISEYSHGTHYNHEPKRDRKLLLNAKEIKKLNIKIKEKGFTIVPLRVFISENGYAKLEIALAKGKAHYDKRESLKKKDAGREMDRHVKK